MNHYTLFPTSFPINWTLKREPVYRLLDDEKWIDKFFETGELLISCLDKFKSYPDEMQGDKEEGKASVRGEDCDGNLHFILYEAGFNAYIMSTTTQLNEKVKADFNAKCAIKINNPTYFALEIAKKLPFVMGGIEGNCVYAKNRMVYLEKEIEEYEFLRNRKFRNDALGLEQFREETRETELFIKLEKYKHQKEYRFIWFSEKEVTDSFIVKSPEAVSHCEKIIL